MWPAPPRKSGWLGRDSAWPAQRFQNGVNPRRGRRRGEPRHRAGRPTNLRRPVWRRQPRSHVKFLKNGSGRDRLAGWGWTPAIHPVVQPVPRQAMLRGKLAQGQNAGAVASDPACHLRRAIGLVSGQIMLHSATLPQPPPVCIECSPHTAYRRPAPVVMPCDGNRKREKYYGNLKVVWRWSVAAAISSKMLLNCFLKAFFKPGGIRKRRLLYPQKQLSFKWRQVLLPCQTLN